jgi:hypothetical protein
MNIAMRLTVVALGAESPEQAVYEKAPVYSPAQRLADARAVAELVVLGTPDKEGRLLFVEETLFGSAKVAHLTSDHRTPKNDYGFALSWREGRLIKFEHRRKGKVHGVARTYDKRKFGLLREETRFVNGVPHGRARTWDENGTLTDDRTYDRGLVTPIFRYRGKDKGSAIRTGHNGSCLGPLR